jgi:hypothetical protein
LPGGFTVFCLGLGNRRAVARRVDALHVVGSTGFGSALMELVLFARTAAAFSKQSWIGRLCRPHAHHLRLALRTFTLIGLLFRVIRAAPLRFAAT